MEVHSFILQVYRNSSVYSQVFENYELFYEFRTHMRAYRQNVFIRSLVIVRAVYCPRQTAGGGGVWLLAFKLG